MARRSFLRGTGIGLGTVALAHLLGQDAEADEVRRGGPLRSGDSSLGLVSHFPPRARHVIYLCQSGGPSQLDLFDYKPALAAMRGKELPDSVRRGQRITTMTSKQSQLSIVPAQFQFARRGQAGNWISELLPHTATVADELCFIKSTHTDAINHDPAITFLLTGSERAGRPSFGAWISYALGSENQNLPSFVVLLSASRKAGDQPLYARLWGSGFLPTRHQGVRFRGAGDPVLYLTNPPGMSHELRGEMLADVRRINQFKYQEFGDPEIATRIAQYELAGRMQVSLPDLVDLSGEPEHIRALYGPEVEQPGSYAANCLLARRMIERGVRCVQLCHRGWDQHSDLPANLGIQCRATDQPTAALIRDLKQRGLLDDTLIVWAGEFGRTVYCQGDLTANNYGRDHHPRCFTVWMAGGGTRGGMSYGETDDFSYNITRDPVHVHDLNATILHCLGIDHERLTFKFQGRHHRLTDIGGSPVHALLG